MKKILFLSVAILLLLNLRVSGQCVILDVKLNDCASCRYNLTLMDDVAKSLPVYAIFEERLKNDSADIDFKLGLSGLGVKYLFNDYAYRKYHNGDIASSWYVLDPNGNVVLNGDIKDFNEYVIPDSLKKVTTLLPPCHHCQIDFTKNRGYLLNIDVDKIHVWSKTDKSSSYDLRSRNFDFKSILENLKGQDSLIFAQAGILLNTKGKGFRPGYTWFDISPNGDLLAMMQYVHPVMRDSLTVEIRQCIIVYDSTGKQKNVLFINLDSVRNYDNYTGRFIVLKDGAFITFTHPVDDWFDDQLKKDSTAKIPFITSFSLNKNKGYYTPLRKYDIDLPDVYKKKYFENYLSPELCSYPFISFRYANELHDLNTLKHVQVIEKSVYDNHVSLSDKVLGNEKFAVLTVSTVNEKVLLVYKLDDDVYINFYSKELNYIKTVSLGKLLTKHLTDDCFIDPYAEQVYFTFDGDANTLSLPLHLFN